MTVNLSRDILRGISLALWAAQNGYPRVVVGNKALQEWLGKEKVHEARIEKLAETLKPIFFKHRIEPDRYTKGHTLTLYLKQKDRKFIPILESCVGIDSTVDQLTA